jgi:hypothetical protein
MLNAMGKILSVRLVNQGQRERFRHSKCERGFLRSFVCKFISPPQDSYFDQSTSLVGSFICKGIAGRDASAVVWFLATVDCHIDTVHALEIFHTSLFLYFPYRTLAGSVNGAESFLDFADGDRNSCRVGLRLFWHASVQHKYLKINVNRVGNPCGDLSAAACLARSKFLHVSLFVLEFDPVGSDV